MSKIQLLPTHRLPSYRASLLVSTLVIGLAACSGGNGGGGTRADGGGGNGDGGGGVCSLSTSDFGDTSGSNTNAFSASQYLTVDVEIGSTTDLFIVELFEGVAPFESGFTTGTFEISGSQTDYNTCGACVSVWANIADGSAELVYLAQSGTLVIDSVDGDFTGSFTPSEATATFVGYRPTTDTSSVEVPECTINGGSVTWDATIETE